MTETEREVHPPMIETFGQCDTCLETKGLQYFIYPSMGSSSEEEYCDTIRYCHHGPPDSDVKWCPHFKSRPFDQDADVHSIWSIIFAYDPDTEDGPEEALDLLNLLFLQSYPYGVPDDIGEFAELYELEIKNPRHASP
jgi:hypothetical protein